MVTAELGKIIIRGNDHLPLSAVGAAVNDSRKAKADNEIPSIPADWTLGYRLLSILLRRHTTNDNAC